MPATQAQRSEAARKAAATRKRHAEEAQQRRTAAVDRTAEFSGDVLTSLEAGQRAAIQAVQRFVDTVDEVLPALGERPSRRQKVVDAAMEMADGLVHTQYDFIRKVVESARVELSRTEGEKPDQP